MKEQILSSTINFLEKYHNYSEKEIAKIKYGLEGLYLTFTKLFVIVLLALILGIFKELLLVLIFFNAIRFFGFGFHAEKSSECLVLSIFNFILIPLFFSQIELSRPIYLIIAGTCIIFYLLFAPADTVKRPLKNKKKRLIRKTLTCLTGVIYTILIFLFKSSYLSSIIVSSMIIQGIVICPLTYRMFNQPYNNYKN